MSKLVGDIAVVQATRESAKLEVAEKAYGRLMKDFLSEKRRVRELEEQLEEAIKQAIYDPLTGLVTRREMERQITLHFASLERAERMVEKGRAQTAEVEAFSILFFDLNGLKTVNDMYGHKAGDLLIETFASALEAHFLRGTDVVCRWGGDEFLVLLGGVTPREKARKIADDFLSALSDVVLHFSSSCENNPSGASHSVPVRVAVGVSSTSDGFRTMETMIAAADTEMYDHKKESGEARQ